MISIVIISIVVISVFCYYIINKNSEQKNKMSFKEASDLVGLPIVTFYVDNFKLHFLLDTGADRSLINSAIINNIPHSSSGLQIEMVDAGGHPLVGDNSFVTLYYNGKSYDGEFTVTDLSALSDNIDLKVKGNQVVIAGVIGNDFFKKYKYVLDFEKLIAYSKKV